MLKPFAIWCGIWCAERAVPFPEDCPVLHQLRVVGTCAYFSHQGGFGVGSSWVGSWSFLTCPRTSYANSQGLFSDMIPALLAIVMGMSYRNSSASPAEMCFSGEG